MDMKSTAGGAMPALETPVGITLAAAQAQSDSPSAKGGARAPAPARPRYSARRFRSRLNMLSMEAVDCLEQIINDSGAKPADRVAAAKLAFDVAGRQPARAETDGVLRVVFDGIPPEYAE